MWYKGCVNQVLPVVATGEKCKSMVKTKEPKIEKPPNSSLWMVGVGIVVLMVGFGFRYLVVEMGRSPKREDTGDLMLVAAVVVAGLIWIGALTKR